MPTHRSDSLIHSLNLIVAPAKEPISILEAREHLKIRPDDEISDTEIEALIIVAREKIENDIRRSLITQTWEAVSSRFPWSSHRPIDLELPPLQSVVSVEYIDLDGLNQTWDDSLYQVNNKTTPGFIIPIADESYPETDIDSINAVTITFVAGYGDSEGDVPAPVRHAMKLIIGELYARREEAIAGVAITTVPVSANNLISPYVITHF